MSDKTLYGTPITSAIERLVNGTRWIILDNELMFPISEIGKVIHAIQEDPDVSRVYMKAGWESNYFVYTETLPEDMRPS